MLRTRTRAYLFIILTFLFITSSSWRHWDVVFDVWFVGNPIDSTFNYDSTCLLFLPPPVVFVFVSKLIRFQWKTINFLVGQATTGWITLKANEFHNRALKYTDLPLTVCLFVCLCCWFLNNWVSNNIEGFMITSSFPIVWWTTTSTAWTITLVLSVLGW